MFVKTSLLNEDLGSFLAHVASSTNPITMGPSMVDFLKEVYGRAKEADKFLKSQELELKHTWNMLVASLFWDMRLSIACAATNTEYHP